MNVGYLCKDHSDLLNFTMKDGNVILYGSKYVHLGTSIYTHNCLPIDILLENSALNLFTISSIVSIRYSLEAFCTVYIMVTPH